VHYTVKQILVKAVTTYTSLRYCRIEQHNTFYQIICATRKWQSQVGSKHVMKAYGKAEVHLQALIMSQLDGGKQ